MGEAVLGTSPGAERDARMAFWTEYMRRYGESPSTFPERRIRQLRDDYVAGLIDLETFEWRVEVAIFAERSPQP